MITPQDMTKNLRECLDDPTVRAIILRIDSPGGDATASDLIWRELRRVAKEKPVIASMSDVAASGGYYIAMGADRIVAQPGTITGSIGVVGGKLALEGLFQKLGITSEISSRGQNAGMLSMTTPFSDSQRAAFERVLGSIYQDFVAKAAESRRMTPADLEAVAQGRVWTGRQGYKNGLVDELGGLETALAMAKEMAGIEKEREVEVVVYPKRLGLLEVMQKLLGAEAPMASASAQQAAALRSILPAPAVRCAALLPLFREPRPLALMPYVFEFR
ncbi:MAG: signal peptide peptidase SppA [Candidatus Sumerlaeota bacterium]|nr:signal peptide peptidase SppA [Candidatus Sumerlaeota bacterium]